MATPDPHLNARTLDLARTYAQAQRALADRVRAALRSGDLASARRVRAQLAEVLRTLDELGRATDPQARALVADAHAFGAAKAADQIAALPGAPAAAPGTFNGVAMEAVQALEAEIVGNLDAARRRVGRSIEDTYARAQRRVALRAVLGEAGSPRSAKRALMTELLKDREIRRGVEQAGTALVDRAGKRWALDTYAEMAIRTTTRTAVVEGSLARMASHGVNLARVSRHATECPICLPWENRLVSLDGQASDYEGEPVATLGAMPNGGPPFHPNCLIEGTIVEATGVYAAYRARYSGDVVDLTTVGGVRLTVTPNHPVMTTTGWLPAGELREGDHVLRAADGQAPIVPGEHHLHQVPTAVEHVFDALTTAGRRTGVAAASDDFHGDALYFKGEVDVVLADRELRREVAASIVQQPGKGGLVRTSEDERALVGQGAGTEMLRTLLPAPHGGVRSIGRARTNSHSVLAQSLRHGAAGHVGVERERVQSFAAEVAARVLLDVGNEDLPGRGGFELLGDCPHGHAVLLELGAHAGRARAELARQVTEGSPLGVHADELLSVNRKAYTGHVYDLSTRDGHYRANTVSVSNCKHTLQPVAVRIDAIRRQLAGASG